jgi:hypothetical protein
MLLRMYLLWSCAALPLVAAGATTACTGELLYNGICYQAPARTASPPLDPVTPPYLNMPPALINITLGRQLFVDDFLVHNMTGLQFYAHEAEWEKNNPVIKADRPWEAKVISTLDPGFPQGPSALGQALTYSGGVWYDEQRELYRCWYMCGKPAESPGPTAGGCCYAESTDGRHWDKPIVNETMRPNVALYGEFEGNIVWLDHHPGPPAERWKRATVRKSNHFGAYQILTSADGLAWSERVPATGPTEDRATFWYNPFRKKWVWSIKSRFAHLGRSRSYLERDDLLQDTDWKQSDPLPWTGADSADPPNPYNPAIAAELYNLDGAAYESVMVGFFSIFRGFVDAAGNATSTRTSGEWNEVSHGR